MNEGRRDHEPRGNRPGERGAWRLGVAAVALVVLSGVFYLGLVLTEPGTALHQAFSHLWYLHDVGAERNIPSWYTGLLWAVLGGAAFGVAGLARRRAPWILLGAIALAASIDEHSELHERLDQIGTPIAAALGWSMGFTWVIPGAVLAVVVAATLWPLVWRLPARSRLLVFAGGALFLMGAVVVETLAGLVLTRFGGQVTWHFIALTLAEEALEMLGLVLAIAGVGRLFLVGRTPDGERSVRLEEGGSEPRQPLSRWGRAPSAETPGR